MLALLTISQCCCAKMYVYTCIYIHGIYMHLLCCFCPLLLCLRELMLLTKYLLQNTASSSRRVECRLSTFTTFDSLLESYYIQGNRTMLLCTRTYVLHKEQQYTFFNVNKCVCVLASESNNTFMLHVHVHVCTCVHIKMTVYCTHMYMYISSHSISVSIVSVLKILY